MGKHLVSDMMGNKPHKCEICEKTYIRASFLKKHMYRHKDQKPYKCKYCKKLFRAKSKWRAHLNTHERNTYECAICSQVFSTRHILLIHMTEHNNQKPFKCETCGKSFSMKITLNKHMKIHNGNKPFQCEVCEKCFSRKNTLSEHMKTHLGQKPFKCDECGKTFTKKFSLSLHINGIHGYGNMRTYKCNLCQKTLSSKYYFKVHLAEHDTKRLFKCETCGRCFVLKCTLKEHMKTHLREKAFQCEQCGKTFTRKFYLSVHIKNIHKHDINLLHDCHMCNKQFRNKRHLEQHVKKHAQSDCPLCLKSTRECNCSWNPADEMWERLRKRLAREHLMMRCITCNKSILRYTQLKLHLAIHGEVKCIPCNKNYKDCHCCDDYMEVAKTVNTYKKPVRSASINTVNKAAEETVSGVNVKNEVVVKKEKDDESIDYLSSVYETIIPKNDNNDCSEVKKTVRTYQRSNKRVEQQVVVKEETLLDVKESVTKVEEEVCKEPMEIVVPKVEPKEENEEYFEGGENPFASYPTTNNKYTAEVDEEDGNKKALTVKVETIEM